MASTKWAVDASHSEIQFKVRHLMISNVTGEFTKFDASVETEDENFETALISFSADVASVTTKNEQRDEHLKSAEFFDAANFPTIDFKGKSLVKTGGEDYVLTGDLTVRGVTKEVKLDVVFGGVAADPWGNHRAGFELSGKINRKDFGLSWHAVTEAGGVVVSDEVKLFANVEFLRM